MAVIQDVKVFFFAFYCPPKRFGDTLSLHPKYWNSRGLKRRVHEVEGHVP